MTLAEAEKFFKAFDGRKFHMDRDEPVKSKLYEQLNIPREMEERWFEEIAAEKKKREMLPQDEYDAMEERLLKAPYHVIDFLPRQVPADSKGQYFAVEDFLSESPQIEALYRKFADLMIKLNCYYDLVITDGIRWSKNKSPNELYIKIAGCSEKEYVNILIVEEDVLITLSGGDLYMTVYNASGELLDTIKQLASADGLFVR